jgi:hypothetical protein
MAMTAMHLSCPAGNVGHSLPHAMKFFIVLTASCHNDALCMLCISNCVLIFLRYSNVARCSKSLVEKTCEKECDTLGCGYSGLHCDRSPPKLVRQSIYVRLDKVLMFAPNIGYRNETNTFFNSSKVHWCCG